MNHFSICPGSSFSNLSEWEYTFFLSYCRTRAKWKSGSDKGGIQHAGDYKAAGEIAARLAVNVAIAAATGEAVAVAKTALVGEREVAAVAAG
ncbi:hypothetical protein [Brucella haematophila]|uniref:Uncharacterized protein n=1 Tax=Brucella haematophila TaxID=419474 RepID=A0ABX1DU92_9HYPH|nr:hypothetical protein [Brucella haematophila]TMU95480.1 hypothetical protein FGI60_20430 [Brucella haematophila]